MKRGPEVLRRRGARLLVLDADDAVLLVRAVDPTVPDAPFWFTVGGGVEAGETERAAAVRELREEVGLAVSETDLVGPVFRADDAFPFDGRWIEQSNVFYAVRVPAAALPGPVDARADEIATLETAAWWTPEQLRAHVEGRPHDGPGRPGELVYPPALPDVVAIASGALAAVRA
jgi:8-oxo-dGTP pyrophosphatase MutT (NUDIX family)